MNKICSPLWTDKYIPLGLHLCDCYFDEVSNLPFDDENSSQLCRPPGQRVETKKRKMFSQNNVR